MERFKSNLKLGNEMVNLMIIKRPNSSGGYDIKHISNNVRPLEEISLEEGDIELISFRDVNSEIYKIANPLMAYMREYGELSKSDLEKITWKLIEINPSFSEEENVELIKQILMGNY